MSEFLGSRISLISKSDIRYSGILHEINSSESTVSLENVKSYGTEGRKGNPAEEIPGSDQLYDYIVFRGSDVKDLRIDEAPAKEAPPPQVPLDPAIVNARPRPNPAVPSVPVGPSGSNVPGGPDGPGGPPGPFGGNQFYGNWPRQGGPGGPGMPGMPGMPGGPGGPGMPGGPGFNGLAYPPPPGWFPPGPGFPPAGMAPWGNYYPPPGTNTPPGQGPTGRQPQPPQQPEQKPTPIGAGTERSKGPAAAAPGPAPTEPNPFGQPMQQATASAPTPPVGSKPSVAEVKATAASLARTAEASRDATMENPVPTGPKMVNRITPALPLPTGLTHKAAQQSVPQTKTSAVPSAAAIRDATEAARAAVAQAMANLERGNGAVPAASQQPNGSNAMDNLTKKVNEMRVSAGRANSGNHRGGGAGGRGRGPRPAAKVEVPDADFDFATSNAKFNKSDLVKEATACPHVGESAPVEPVAVDGAKDEESPAPTAGAAYNKATSFFDNISSEARERAENNGQRAGGREWRDGEQRKNMETFGQGSVDGGAYRQNGYRGRSGRGKGGRGRGAYGRAGGGGRGNHSRTDGSQAAASTL